MDGPVALNYYTETYKVTDSNWEDSTRIATRYKPGEKIWFVFEVKEPKAVPEPVMITSGRFRGQETEASKQLRASITASNDVLHKALDAEIRAFNQGFYGRLHDRIYFVNVNEVTIEDRVTKTDPGKILFGGNATIQGAVFNDKSQIAAASALRIDDGPPWLTKAPEVLNALNKLARLFIRNGIEGVTTRLRRPILIPFPATSNLSPPSPKAVHLASFRLPR